MLIINFALYHHLETLVHILIPTKFSSSIQLKTDILNKAILSVPFTSDSNAYEAFSDSDPILPTNANDIMLDNLLKSVTNDTDDAPNDEEGATANNQCENELYQLLLGNDFKMIMQDIETKVYNCPLSWWKLKLSGHQFMNVTKLAIKYLAVPAISAPSEHIWSRAARVLTVKQNRMKEEVTAAMRYCRENKLIPHKHYTEITKERMHKGDHNLIAKHKALLPTFEDENDEHSESNIDVEVEVEEEE
jgi:hypothetical protein